MMNKWIGIGRLVADPQLRYTQSGIAVCNFTVAVDRPYVTQGGDRKADFIDIVTWRKQAEVCAKHLSKGRLVAIEGRLEIRSYDDQNNIRRRAAEIVAEQIKFLDRKKTDSDEASESASDEAASTSAPEPEFDDIPF